MAGKGGLCSLCSGMSDILVTGNFYSRIGTYRESEHAVQCAWMGWVKNYFFHGKS